jgi:hypothetical protein
MSRQEKLAALASTGVTKAELDNIDGGTARGTTAIADGDGVLINDAGTMRMTSVETMATYMGTKITGGSMVYLASSGAISNAASVAFTQFDASKYDHYEFWFQHLIPVTDGTLLIGYASTDGGSNYDTTNGNYHHDGNVDAPGFYIIDQLVGNGTNEFGVGGKFQLLAPHNASAYTYSISQTSVMTSAGPSLYIASTNGTNGASTVHLVAADVDAIQFKFSSGNIASGEIVMYGIANGT